MSLCTLQNGEYVTFSQLPPERFLSAFPTNCLFYVFFVVVVFVFAVAVNTMTVMAGDRVELNCDVSAEAGGGGVTASAVFDRRHQLIIDNDDQISSPSAGYLGFDSRSQRGNGGGRQYRHHRSPAAAAKKHSTITSSSMSSRETTSTTRGRRFIRRANYRRPPDGDSHADSSDDGGYLVLWFIDPERKPFYRYLNQIDYFISLTDIFKTITKLQLRRST